MTLIPVADTLVKAGLAYVRNLEGVDREKTTPTMVDELDTITRRLNAAQTKNVYVETNEAEELFQPDEVVRAGQTYAELLEAFDRNLMTQELRNEISGLALRTNDALNGLDIYWRRNSILD